MNKEKFNKLQKLIYADLPLKETGLYLTILSMKDSWNFSTKGLSAILPDSASSIEKGLKSLENRNLLTRRAKIHNGRFSGAEYILYSPNCSKLAYPSKETFSYILQICMDNNLKLEDRGFLLKTLFLKRSESFTQINLSCWLHTGKDKIASIEKRLTQLKYIVVEKIGNGTKYVRTIINHLLLKPMREKPELKKAKTEKNAKINTTKTNTLKEDMILDKFKKTYHVTNSKELKLLKALHKKGSDEDTIIKFLFNYRNSKFLQGKSEGQTFIPCVSWLINNFSQVLSGIYNDFSKPTKGKIRPKRSFDQRTYDFAELERKLLDARNNRAKKIR